MIVTHIANPCWLGIDTVSYGDQRTKHSGHMLSAESTNLILDMVKPAVSHDFH